LRTGFGRLLRSDELRRRICQGHFDLGIPWPPFSDDPWEQFLVCEALAVGWRHEQAARQQEQQEKTDARAQAENQLQAYLAERGR
jgi:hypothetical protein